MLLNRFQKWNAKLPKIINTKNDHATVGEITGSLICGSVQVPILILATKSMGARSRGQVSNAVAGPSIDIIYFYALHPAPKKDLSGTECVGTPYFPSWCPASGVLALVLVVL